MRQIIALFFLLLPTICFADGGFRTTAEILQSAQPMDTRCSTRAFADALATGSNAIDENASTEDVRYWIYETMQDPDVLMDVLACPEFENISDTDTVRFIPITYTFPSGREIVINYETQPHILEQHIKLANKKPLPTDNPNPAVSLDDPDAIWTNTNPAWYAIMVTQAGALSEFVGPNKNNTVSFQWIEDNISKLYPQNPMCSDKTGISRDDRMINRVLHKTVTQPKDEKDSNDYYIAGDRDLRWVSYAEIVAEVVVEVVLSVATVGAGAAITGAAKMARARKILSVTGKNIKRLSKIDKVKDFIRVQSKAKDLVKYADNLTDLEKILKNENKYEKILNTATKGSKKYTRAAERLEKLRADKVKKIKDIGKDAEGISFKNIDKINDLRKTNAKELEEVTKNMDKMKDASKDVREYTKQADAYDNTVKFVKELKNYKQPVTGNVLTRNWQRMKNIGKTMRAINRNSKGLDAAAKVGRHGMQSGKIRNFLFHATRKNIASLGKVVEAGGALSLALTFMGEMYDATDVKTGEFTNNINMKPYLLLSADDIQGQDNVVNYGMWLMWLGDSTSEEDDNAAYLQAMDFAQKFYQDLTETQDEENAQICDVDIYVARPIIRNPGTDHESLYWLIMNDEPWSTVAETVR